MFGYVYALREVQIDEAQQESYSRNFGPDLEFVEDLAKYVIDRLDNVVSSWHFFILSTQQCRRQVKN